MDKLFIIKELKKLLSDKFQDLDQVILYGSQVNGKADDDSDYDVLIVLSDDFDWKRENEILDVCYEIDLKHDILIDARITSRRDLETIIGRQPFILNALDSGVRV
ncbi:MAG: nucleotidyltransferase domain-containing protein [Candidatus Wallbacteria bacterium]|nr:nucleotidyltransferase domain-containing protein [Candidatus Wallbacteria bacterium]